MTNPLDKTLQTSSSSRIPSVAIFITAASWAGFAIWLGLNPGALLPAFGVEASTPQMLTEVRAFYGGVEMAIAVAMVVLWRRGDLFAALLIGGLPLVGSATGRCIGLMVDGFCDNAPRFRRFGNCRCGVLLGRMRDHVTEAYGWMTAV